MDITRVITRPHVTEKAYRLQEGEKQVLTFLVDKKANKYQIKEAFMAIYSQKPEKISIVNRRSVKINYRRANEGYTRAQKIAYVTLPKGVRLTNNTEQATPANK